MVEVAAHLRLQIRQIMVLPVDLVVEIVQVLQIILRQVEQETHQLHILHHKEMLVEVPQVQGAQHLVVVVEEVQRPLVLMDHHQLVVLVEQDLLFL
jgi:hypothetical protein